MNVRKQCTVGRLEIDCERAHGRVKFTAVSVLPVVWCLAFYLA